MAKRPTVIANDHVALRVWPFVFLGCLFLFLWLGWSSKQGGPLLLAVLCACASGLFFVQSARWKRIHTARQRAVSDGMQAGILLASPQPRSTGELLPDPFQLTLQPRWILLLTYSILVGAGMFVLWSLINGDPRDLLMDWPLHLIVPLYLSVEFFWRNSLRQRIVASADGLLVQDPLYDWLGSGWQTGKRQIAWQNARLFAIRGGQPGTPGTRYELSSPTTVVTFGRSYPNHRWALYRPVLAWENYEFQMEALLALIAAKTELPLYDVRAGPATEPSPQPFLSREQS